MEYDFNKIEKKWRKIWLKERVYEPDLKNATLRQAQGKKPFYNLMMFPYPSAEGLHVGNMYAFTGADIYGRMKRMQGYDVFEPIGLDGFGIHSENYALKVGTHPMKQSKVSEKRFYEQLEAIGNGFAWDEHLETYDPEYYRWTQWLFIQLWKAGLAYRKKQAVNWCPKDKTVLADEQVEGGKCERCGSVVEKRELEQWFFRITNYADRLLKNLETLDWSGKVKIAQRNWIGKSEGAEIEFGILNNESRIKVFTTRPDTLFGATYMVLAPEHALVRSNELGITNYEEVKEYIDGAVKKSDTDRVVEGKDKTGVELKGVKAINPATKKEIPIWVADYVLGGVGTGAIMAVPAHDERDFEFAMRYNLPIKQVVAPQIDADNNADLRGNKKQVYTAGGVLKDSDKFDGMDSEEAKQKITEFVGGKLTTQFRLRDWLISRQRYWGPPIPMIFCESCAAKGIGEHAPSSAKATEGMAGWYAVPENQLPVELPNVKDFRPTGSGVSPLASVKSFYETKCPSCGGEARRETDVSDTFLDSAWYYLRYPSVNNKELALDPDITKKWLPVHMYTGGAEHSVLHLLYSRFISLALHDLKFLEFEEPFPKFRAHGLLIKDGAKMSKSKGNVVNPDEYIANFGADVLRTFLMFLAPFEQGGDFRDQALLGIERFLKRVWKFAADKELITDNSKPESAEFLRVLHGTVKKVTEDIENLHYNTAVSALMILLNEMEVQGTVSEESFVVFIKLLAPLAPYMTEEIWRTVLGNKTSIHREAWPVFNPKMLVATTMQIVLQINGKLKDTIEVPVGTGEEEVKKLGLENEKIKASLAGKSPKRVIYVQGRVLNIVV